MSNPLQPKSSPIPITVFTGFLGAGKTTTILSLLPQLPAKYKVVLLKNEFGDVEVDSQLAKQSSLTAVSEILNGCLCCVLVGQMKNALLEIRETHEPNRIIIETSSVPYETSARDFRTSHSNSLNSRGSAFPATLAFQIRDLEREYPGWFTLDAILTVIDAENFVGYEDTSVTARMQAQYTDIILVNKWENVSERHLDIVMDHLFTLNEDTPKLKCSGRNGISPSLVFGVDSKLFLTPFPGPVDEKHHDEVETVSVFRGVSPPDHDHHHDQNYSSPPNRDKAAEAVPLTRSLLEEALTTLSKESVYRVKGFVTFDAGGKYVLNWAFGRFDLTPFVGTPTLEEEQALRVTMMGARGETRRWARKFAELVGATLA